MNHESLDAKEGGTGFLPHGRGFKKAISGEIRDEMRRITNRFFAMVMWAIGLG